MGSEQRLDRGDDLGKGRHRRDLGLHPPRGGGVARAIEQRRDRIADRRRSTARRRAGAGRRRRRPPARRWSTGPRLGGAPGAGRRRPARRAWSRLRRGSRPARSAPGSRAGGRSARTTTLAGCGPSTSGSFCRPTVTIRSTRSASDVDQEPEEVEIVVPDRPHGDVDEGTSGQVGGAGPVGQWRGERRSRGASTARGSARRSQGSAGSEGTDRRTGGRTGRHADAGRGLGPASAAPRPAPAARSTASGISGPKPTSTYLRSASVHTSGAASSATSCSTRSGSQLSSTDSRSRARGSSSRSAKISVKKNVGVAHEDRGATITAASRRRRSG